jgi:hypothetical protein
MPTLADMQRRFAEDFEDEGGDVGGSPV